MTRDLSYACQAVVVQSLSHVQLFAIPWAVACQAAMAWDFPSKNTGVDCHVLLQGIFPNQGSNPHLLHWQVDSLPLSDAMANCKLPQLMIHSWLWQLWITTVLYFHITFFFFLQFPQKLITALGDCHTCDCCQADDWWRRKAEKYRCGMHISQPSVLDSTPAPFHLKYSLTSINSSL